MNMLAGEAVCFHCGTAVGEDALIVAVNGQPHRVCSESCRSAAAQIDRLDLGRYYDYREKFAKTDAEPEADFVAERGARDRSLEIAACVTPAGNASRLSVRVPDIRCAACTWLIESSLKQRADVSRCVTNLADRRVQVDFTGSEPMEIVSFIEGLGYTVLPDRFSEAQQALDAERKSMLARLGVAGIGMMQVMMYAIATYVAGDGGIQPAYESLMRWASVAIATPIVIYSAEPFHRGAWRDLRHGSAGMDVPVSLAILAAYGLSLFNTIRGGGEVFFDSATMFTFLLLIGRFIEIGSRRRYQTSRMLSDSLLPDSALLDDGQTRVPVTKLVAGQVVRVAAGESVPADGVIVDGRTTVVEAAFTGESKPIEKLPGMRVLAGSDNLDGAIRVRATADHGDFVISQISRLYRESVNYKPRFSMIADVAARYFVAFILIAAALSAAGWYVAGNPQWFSVGLAVLVVSCPCALSLATPVAYTVAVAAMRMSGIVIANGALLERLARITRVIFDKTGTLTTGKMRIDRVVPLAGVPSDTLLEIAAALEEQSRHPVAAAFARPTPLVAEGVEVVSGEGVRGVVDGAAYRLGKVQFAAGRPVAAPDSKGNWILLAGDVPLGWFRLVDEIRPESAEVVESLGKRYAVSMFTGDVSDEARQIAAAAGIADVSWGMSPQDKVHEVRAAQEKGERVLMVGDGINDAAALAAAAASVAVSPADIVVQEAADATLLHADLRRIPLAIEFAHKVQRIIRENMAWAVLYNLVVIPLAVAGMIQPWMAALGMSASSVLVVLNANRLHKVD